MRISRVESAMSQLHAGGMSHHSRDCWCGVAEGHNVLFNWQQLHDDRFFKLTSSDMSVGSY